MLWDVRIRLADSVMIATVVAESADNAQQIVVDELIRTKTFGSVIRVDAVEG